MIYYGSNQGSDFIALKKKTEISAIIYHKNMNNSKKENV